MTDKEIFQFAQDVNNASDVEDYEKLFKLLNEHYNDVPVGCKQFIIDVVEICKENIKSMRVICNSDYIPSAWRTSFRYNTMKNALKEWCNE